MTILYLASRFPYPIDRGDKLRAFHQVRYLSRDHDVVLFSLAERPPPADDRAVLARYCKRVEVARLPRWRSLLYAARFPFNTLPLQINYFRSAGIRKRIAGLVENIRPDHIVCQLIRMAEYVKHCPCPKTLDYMDAFSYRAEQRTAWHAPWLAPIVRLEARRVRAYERQVFDHFDHRLITTDSDRNRIDHPGRAGITVVPNGVDGSYFKPMDVPREFDVVFVGNMSYPPNIQAALTLVNDILPIVRASLPRCRVRIAGADPPARVRALASEAVSVTGWVDDIRACYASARVFAAPMETGTGLQNKLLEAMAMGIPCVASPLAGNALNAGPDTIRIADTPGTFADALVTLLTGEAAAARQAENALAFVREHHDWNVTLNALGDICGAS